MVARARTPAALAAPLVTAKARGRPRTKAADVRREELMDAAQGLFLAKGIAATSVDDIVAAAGVAKGTFYLYFSSKEMLLLALRKRFVTSFCTLAGQALSRPRADHWRARLRAWTRACVHAYLDQVALHDLVFHDFQPHHRQATCHNPVVEEFAEFLNAGVRAGAWTLDQPRLTALMFCHALHGAVDDAVAGGAPDRRRLVQGIGDFFERALALPPESSAARRPV